MNTVQRPDPDELLMRMKAESENHLRGRLKIFFGYAAGVGKTYAMLENAQRALANGKDVVIGYVEPHARPKTQQLTQHLESIPTRAAEHRGVQLREFDLDRGLERRPEILLVDELAHTNAPGSRHEKRWQDVHELLENGIDVWTTLNVQHIESLNDVVEQVTGVTVRETIPDQVFESADEIELVDLPPEDLLERLGKGHIYDAAKVKHALESFFKRSNLSALRELSLRQTASRVHTEVETARRIHSADQTWATTESLLVCVGPSPTTARVIRTARRMAAALDAKWMAVSVELPGQSPHGRSAAQLAGHFRLAERLGAETVTLSGNSVAEAILDYARSRNITKILIGKTHTPKWKRLLWGSVVDALIESSREIDVYVIQGESESETSAAPHPKRNTVIPWQGFAIAILATSIAGIFAGLLGRYNLAAAEANRVMLFLASVAFVAFRCGARPAILASVLSVLIFDFFFVPPFLTFAVSDAQYLLTFAVMLTIGLLISTLASRLQLQIESARRQEARSHALHELGKVLSSLYGEAFLVTAASKKIGQMLSAEVVVYLRPQGGNTYTLAGQQSTIVQHPVSLPAAEYVIEHGGVAGLDTNTLPNAPAFFLPLSGSQKCLGCMAVRPLTPGTKLTSPETRRLLESCARQLAIALERDQLAVEAAESRMQAETEQLRNTLLNSVSHDLKTPLASIAGASSSLLFSTNMNDQTQRSLLETISSEAQRLNRLLENLLQMSRLEAGAATANLQWHVVEEIVGSALASLARDLTDHPVTVNLPTDLPLILVDSLMLEQVLINLLENACKYTPLGTPICISGSARGSWLTLTVRDQGPGIPAGMEERIFDKFHRIEPRPDTGRGSGLGLAICRAITKVLGGSISASNTVDGGASFELRLPLSAHAPQVEDAVNQEAPIASMEQKEVQCDL